MRNWLNRFKTSKIEYYKSIEVPLNPAIFGLNLKSPTMPVSYMFGSGGVGDYINWCSAINFIKDTFTHADGRIFTSKLFLPVAQYLYGNLPRWKVIDREFFYDEYENNSILAYPKQGTQLWNACGGHLMDLGFAYFCCTNPPPEKYNYLTEINYEGPWKWPELDPDSEYAVFTPGATAGVREMPFPAFNELAHYVKSKGVTPVFLGKCELSEEYRAKFLPYDFTLGVDLRERTSLLEATQIIKRAKFIVGLDNGLLHMAGTTTTPVIFGHNITEIHHRDLRRREGLTFNVTVAEETLACIGCQSRMRMLYKHDFRNCFFKKDPNRDKICLMHLFKDGAREWKKIIDSVLENGDEYREKKAKSVNVYVK
jgi:hypothetical protein